MMAKSKSKFSINLLLALLSLIMGEALMAPTGLAQQPQLTQQQDNPVAFEQGLEQGPDGADRYAQIEASLVQITAIRLESTELGVQVIIEAEGGLAAPTQSVSGNALLLDISNATLSAALPEPFEAFAPAEGIALVQVSELSEDRVQIVVTGADAVPTAEISATAAGLTATVAPGLAQAVAADEPLRLVVTGEEDSRYVAPNATTATRTDTPLRDIPQSIQVIPQEVLEDQGVLRLNDALRNVSGVTTDNSVTAQTFTVRGFSDASVLRDGFQAVTGINGVTGYLELANVEQLEVLKGPASILFGLGDPGGVINLVTERPQSEPSYELGLRLGNRGLVEPNLDLTGPLTEDGRVAYRINAIYRNEDYFRDFNTPFERLFIAPSISFAPNDNTDVVVDLEYRDQERPNDTGLVAVGDGVADIPFDRALTSPDLASSTEALRAGYRFEHRFSDNWKVRNAFYYSGLDAESNLNIAGLFLPPGFPIFNETTGILSILPSRVNRDSDDLELQTNVVGEFSTGSIDHTLLIGVDFFRSDIATDISTSFPNIVINPLNVFDPDYDSFVVPDFDSTSILTVTDELTAEGLGIYVQDQIKLLDNLIVLAGLRYDTISQDFLREATLLSPRTETSSTSDAFSPRLGVVYQPTEQISLYGSYSRSFFPNSARTVEGDVLEPEQGEQFEVGARAELLEGALVTNLAFFNIDKENVAVADPVNPSFSIASAGQRSRGIELDVIGEVLPGWNVVANYAYLDTEVTSSNDGTEGNDLFNVPEHNVNLWTNYEIQTGSLEGLSLGLGFNFVAERFGDLANSFTVDDYFLTNAAIAYQKDNWRAGLNFRNLFNVDYIESASNSRIGSINPGEGFTVVGSFSVTF